MRYKRTKRAAAAVAVLAVVAGSVLVALWRDRANLDNSDWPPAPEAAGGALGVTWLGVTTVLFDDGETQVL
ncbi:MAG: hypothetical protein MJA32_04115, partial [Proteobacteria bacterium]|nr:hypothetical protein [Pseudomonadota bacterium]